MLPEVRKLIGSGQDSKWKISTKVKVYGSLVIAILVISTLIFGVYKVNKFFEDNKLVFQSPIVTRLQAPMYIAKREKVVTIVQEVKANENVSPLTPDQQYLCNKFGTNCKTALAIQKAENGSGKCDVINWSNKNQSLDIGYMQVNTLYVDANKVKPSQLFDCKTNIDFAYQIFLNWGGAKDPAKGFGAWSTFNNNAYKKYLIN